MNDDAQFQADVAEARQRMIRTLTGKLISDGHPEAEAYARSLEILSAPMAFRLPTLEELDQEIE